MKVGRKRTDIDYDFIIIHNRVKNGFMTVEDACKELQMTTATFYRLKRRVEAHQVITDQLKAWSIDDEEIDRFLEEVDKLL